MQRCLGCMEQFTEKFKICPRCGVVVGEEGTSGAIAPGSELFGRYLVGKAIGNSEYGYTYVAFDTKLERKCAVKEYLPSEFAVRKNSLELKFYSAEKQEAFKEGAAKFLDEADRLAKLVDVSGIVDIYDAFSENGTSYYVMEYLQGELLENRIARQGKLSEDEAKKIFDPIIQALSKAHNRNIIHRAITPANIFLLADGSAKLINFSAARSITTETSKSLTVMAWPGYSPPEQYQGGLDQDEKSDIYALSATIYKSLTGITPPDAISRLSKFYSGSKNTIEPISKYNKEVSEEYEGLIMHGLEILPENRMESLEEFCSGKKYALPKRGSLKPVLGVAAVSIVALLIGVAILFSKSGKNKEPNELETKILNSHMATSANAEKIETIENIPVEGINSESAIEQLKELGLEPVIIDSVESEYYEPGVIIYQEPLAGISLEKGATIYLTVSCGAKKPEVEEDYVPVMPYLIGSKLPRAQKKLKDLGYENIVIEYEYDDVIADGNIISQNIDFDKELNGDEKIVLVVSKGKEESEEPTPTREVLAGNYSTPTPIPAPTNSQVTVITVIATATPIPTNTPSPTPTPCQHDYSIEIKGGGVRDFRGGFAMTTWGSLESWEYYGETWFGVYRDDYSGYSFETNSQSEIEKYLRSDAYNGICCIAWHPKNSKMFYDYINGWTEQIDHLVIAHECKYCGDKKAVSDDEIIKEMEDKRVFLSGGLETSSLKNIVERYGGYILIVYRLYEDPLDPQSDFRYVKREYRSSDFK